MTTLIFVRRSLGVETICLLSTTHKLSVACDLLCGIINITGVLVECMLVECMLVECMLVECMLVECMLVECMLVECMLNSSEQRLLFNKAVFMTIEIVEISSLIISICSYYHLLCFYYHLSIVM